MEGNESVVNSFQRKEHVDNFMQNNSTNMENDIGTPISVSY